jgi:hypothetical protein
MMIKSQTVMKAAPLAVATLVINSATAVLGIYANSLTNKL